ncbi:MAG: serine/threonine-protein kinase [Hyphomicrobiaceae bacterium]|jgi:eukaryotic-like serine/threonine-protein kinase
MTGLFDISVETASKLCPEYKFIKRLAKSAQKAAFHVQDASGLDLCLKIIAPNASLERVQREIEALDSLDHPNIVKLHYYEISISEKGFRHFAVEEFIDGCDLSDVLKPGKPWALDDAASLLKSIASGLHALGSARIVHRDLKPSNIRVRPNSQPVIVDLGVARLLDRADLTLTSMGARIGTTLYFAPEQFEGRREDIDPRTDLFALGVIAHEVLLGRHPFYEKGISIDDLREKVCRSSDFVDSADFKALPPRWRLVVQRLLEKQRVRRPKDASLVCQLIDLAAGDK